MSALLTAAVGIIGIAVGWFVSGSQRINEKLTEERRSSFLALLLEADAVQRDPAADRAGLTNAVSRAEYVCSGELLRSGLIARFAASAGTEDWAPRRAQFVTVSRLESIYNAKLLRWWHRRWYGSDAPSA
jgi:hypothetical protein